MTIAFISGTSKGTVVSDTTSSAIDTTGANLIVIAVSYFGASAPTLSDSKGNTYTGLTTFPNNTAKGKMFYCFAPTVGSGHTFTVTETSIFASFHVASFSGVASSPLDQQSVAEGMAKTVSPGSVTPTENDELCVFGLSYRDGGAVSIDSGATVVSYLTRTADYIGSAIAYKVQTSAAAINPEFSWPTTVGYSSAATATFKASAGGDTTAPVLTSPTGTQTGSTTGSGTVTTDEANGTLYSWATTNATETAADIKTSGATQTITTTGSKSVTFTGLSPSTTYYAHYVHRDAAGNDSTASNSSSFTTTSGVTPAKGASVARRAQSGVNSFGLRR